MQITVKPLSSSTRLLLAAVLFPWAIASAQATGHRPRGVTDSAVARGAEVFHGAGGCFKCHGIEGSGTDTGPALRLGVWLHGSDSYTAIIGRVVHGVPKAESLRDTAMPTRGTSQALDKGQVLAVAAYVWWISHAGKNGGGRPQP
jgi:mono/diheme cytochrome c family protein